MATEPHYPIQGVAVPSGQPLPSRMNFNDWSANYEQSISVSLFIRALQRWYSMDYSNMLSYFRTAAIHGYPRELGWNGVSNDSIFCSHGIITFPTWHRPYMLLFEQRISELMIEVIDVLHFIVPFEKQKWLSTASQWRLPYWDWALPSGAGHIPDLFTMPSIAIREPLLTASAKPTTLTVTNPLARYLLQTGSPQLPTAMGKLPKPYTVDDVGKLPWSKCAGTSRWGIKTGVDEKEYMLGINNWQSCNAAIDGHQYEDPPAPINGATITDICYRLLAPEYARDWQTFATTGADRQTLDMKDWIKFLSLEYIHNNLHGFIGGNSWSDGIGHMQNVPSAAFDPIFYMHHCNIDRVLAIYQTLYPNNWFLPSDDPPSNSSLSPFYHTFSGGDTRMFTSEDVKDWTQFGYQYDVLQHQPGESQDQYIARINTWVKANYGGTAKLLLNDPKKLFKDVVIHDHTYDDYMIDVIYDRHALGGDPYTILFHIGEVPEQEITASVTPPTQHACFVGSVYNFSIPLTGTDGERVCKNCDEQAAAGSLSTAQIPLTRTIYNHATDTSITALEEMAPDQVEGYLKDHLHWVVVMSDGHVVPIGELPETKIFVLKGKAQHFHAEDRPSLFGEYEAMASVTQGKPGGAASDEY